METFDGPIAHSSRYRNPQPYAGQRVLVVGFGNSGGEIALDLTEAGIDATLSVRGPVNILPRDLLGLPILTFAIAERRLPARVADALNAPAIRLAVGSLERLGLTRAAKGPRRMIEENGRIPSLDIGTVAMIRAGRIKVRGDVLRFASKAVVFAQSPPERFDAVILATGFRPDLRPLLPDAKGVLSDAGKPLVSGAPVRRAGPLLLRCDSLADRAISRDRDRSHADRAIRRGEPFVALLEPHAGRRLD
jgi:cation diffusion facilitator CzcD-associated flavoprotein CzcO